MPRFKNLVGLSVGRLTVVEFAGRASCGHPTWKCLCTCGKFTIVRSGNLQSTSVRSCGCLAVDTSREKATKHGQSLNTAEHHSEYVTWKNMNKRCNNPKDGRWEDYGGRGITICKRWKSFALFLKDMGAKPKPKNRHTIERVNNSKGYAPSNCIWATYRRQGGNKRNNHIIEYQGQRLCLAEWARRLGIGRLKLYKRLKRGWSIAKAFSTP